MTLGQAHVNLYKLPSTARPIYNLRYTPALPLNITSVATPQVIVKFPLCYHHMALTPSRFGIIFAITNHSDLFLLFPVTRHTFSHTGSHFTNIHTVCCISFCSHNFQKIYKSAILLGFSLFKCRFVCMCHLLVT